MLLVIDIEHPWLAPRMLCFSTDGRKKEGMPEGILEYDDLIGNNNSQQGTTISML
jgi:hypothetical protein